jgi:ABC-2 type transport system ATP-binding protein
VHGEVDVAYRDALVHRFELDVDKKVRAYSKGNRQKVLLIAALMCRPRLLVLDEPTSGLDPLMEQQFRLAIVEAKERGQTVFLSSHMLSEVEALCDRVAILREGVLVEVGSLDQMRHLSTDLVDVTFGGAVPDLSGVAGVRSVRIDGRIAHYEVTGSVDALVKALGSSEVVDLRSREPSLEELFLSLYGRAAGAPR